MVGSAVSDDQAVVGDVVELVRQAPRVCGVLVPQDGVFACIGHYRQEVDPRRFGEAVGGLKGIGGGCSRYELKAYRVSLRVEWIAVGDVILYAVSACAGR